MDLYAVRFYTLLQHAIQLQGEELSYQLRLALVSGQSSKKSDIQEFSRQLENMRRDMLETIFDEDDGSGIQKLASVIGKK